MKGAKMLLHSTNTSTVRGASSPFWRWDEARSDLTSTTQQQTQSTLRDFQGSSQRSSASVPGGSSTDAAEDPSASTSAPLLLEGDSYHISKDGIARTLYRMAHSAGLGGITVEEQFNLDLAKKRFLLRRDRGNEKDSTKVDSRPSMHSNGSAEGVVNVGENLLHELDVQEIGAGVLGGAGTGATTWESSILMSMYFARHPEQLRGHVVELGSGVGLGGMLCAMEPIVPPKYSPNGTSMAQSVTLTDFNPMVLQQCQQNVYNIGEALKAPLHVRKLDWYEFLPDAFEKSENTQKFDTIIACDCAYRHRDIEALASTMRSLLRDENSEIHIFGPSNRSGLDELLQQLQKMNGLSVVTESLEMERYRLVPSKDLRYQGRPPSDPDKSEYPYMASYTSRFLHIVCSSKENITSSKDITS